MSDYEMEYRIAQLIAKKMAGELTPEEERELNAWQHHSEQARALYEKIWSAENKRQRDSLVANFDVKAAWLKVEKKCMSLLRMRRVKHITRWASAAAILAIAMMIGFLHEPNQEEQETLSPMVQVGSAKAILISEAGKQIHLVGENSEEILNLGDGMEAIRRGHVVEYLGPKDTTAVVPTKMNVIQIPKGGEYELILPDGTHVWMNSDSKLSFPSQFGSASREVTLDGEAYFAVTKREKQPFIVKLFDGVRVQVLGTEFNVQAYSDSRTIETTLCQGAVRVSGLDSAMTLSPSQQLVYNGEKRDWQMRVVNTRLYTAWREGMFVFENEPLEDIMTTLSRWYNVSVFYKNAEVKGYHFTGELERYNDFQIALRMIEKTTSVRFVVNGRTVVVEAREDNTNL